MDKKIEVNKYSLRYWWKYGVVAFGALLVLFIFIFSDKRSRLRVEASHITISTVTKGAFNEYIPNTGTVEPAKTVYLDAIEGGTIKRVLKESGAHVKPGDVILELSNLNRELAVLGQEASLNESINRARETRLNIQRNDIEQQQTLALIDYQLNLLKPQYERQKALFDKRFISKQEFEKVETEYLYNVKRRQITYHAYQKDSLDRVRQMNAAFDSEKRMSLSLDGVNRILDNLVIRAPIEGQLATSHWEIGQSVNPGQRLGQVDLLGEYKVRVPIDELYLPKISLGLPAFATVDDKEYALTIRYIYPTVTNGRFEVDMTFTNEVPSSIRRGQSLRLRIELDKPTTRLMLPLGGFYQDTGGNWVYVLETPDKAVRRAIQLGRKNTEFYEVLSGLKEGERVITSSYQTYGEKEVLLIEN